MNKKAIKKFLKPDWKKIIIFVVINLAVYFSGLRYSIYWILSSFFYNIFNTILFFFISYLSSCFVSGVYDYSAKPSKNLKVRIVLILFLVFLIYLSSWILVWLDCIYFNFFHEPCIWQGYWFPYPKCICV